jgi:small subunit ribosomal protein S1
VHISELAAHHVENPREVVSQGDPVNVLILEIDGERRRLSLSLKRVEDDAVPVPRADGGESVHSMPDLRLSEEAFPAGGAVAAPADETEADESDTDDAAEAEVAETEAAGDETEVEADVDVEAVADDAEVEAVADEAEVEDASDEAVEPADETADEPEAEETS